MKIRVKELTVSDKRKGIKVGDVFEVVESNYGGYYVELENGFIKKVLGNKRYWFLGEDNVKVVADDLPKFNLLEEVYYNGNIRTINGRKHKFDKGEISILYKLDNGDWVKEDDLISVDKQKVKNVRNNETLKLLKDENVFVTSKTFDILKSYRDMAERFCFFSGTSTVDFLPTKVVFNEQKKKTTLLFGKAPYEVYTSVASHGDKFDSQEGFLISMAKYFGNQRLLHFAFGYKNKNQRIAYLKGFIHNELLKYEMSISQVNKLSNWCFDKPITFNINGIEHTIELEFKNKGE